MAMDTISGATSIATAAPAGVPGTITRQLHTVVETVPSLDAENAPGAFGVPIKIAAGGVGGAIEANDDATDVAGFLVRNAPSMAPTSAADETDGVPALDKPHGFIPLGAGGPAFLSVKCAQGTPARNGAVHMRVVEDDPLLVGGLEVASDIDVAAAAMVGTGNATAGTLSATQDAEAGVYRIRMTAATTFVLETPSGNQLKQGATGAAYTAGGVTLTVTAGGTPAVAGNTIAVTVTKNNVRLPGVTWAVDGKDSAGVTEIRVQ